MSSNPLLHAALLLALASTAHAAPLTYVGELIDGGAPANGRYDLQLTVHSDAALNSALALPITIENVEVANGRFRVDADFGPLLRAGLPVSPEAAWLEIAVRDAGSKSGFDSLAQREKIALDKAIAACWSSTGDDGSNPAINFLGTLDAQPFEVRVNNQRAARFEPNAISPNLLQGHAGNGIDAGVRGAVIAGGGASPNGDPEVSGENRNVVHDVYGSIGGGVANVVGRVGIDPSVVDAPFATVGGGRLNAASEEGAVVAGGEQNDAAGVNASVVGGERNDARATGAFIGGGFDNDISPDGATGTIAGGNGNVIEAGRATIGGGIGNQILTNAAFATIAGGQDNLAAGSQGSIGGGRGNAVAAAFATVAGGGGNSAEGTASSIAGGSDNLAIGNAAFVAGGSLNCAGASGSFAAGSGARVRAGGDQCGPGTASGVSGGDVGSFVWADRSGGSFASTGPNQFAIRAAGGVGINRAPTGDGELVLSPVQNANAELHLSARPDLETHKVISTGLNFMVRIAQPGAIDESLLHLMTVGQSGASKRHRLGLLGADAESTIAIRVGDAGSGDNGNGASLSLGGTWTNASSRSFKHAFAAIDADSVLDRVLQLPVSRWKYRGADADGFHLGPVAEDFFAAFGLGNDARYITTADASGVAFAAIQGLHARLASALERREREASAHARDIEALRMENAQQRSLIATLAARIDALDASR